MFQNGGARGVLSNETFNNLSKEQVWAADEAINTKINNKQMKSAVVQLPGKWVYQYMGQNAVDMDLIDAQDKTFQRICNLLGCNPQLFETGTTFNNVEQARKDLITNAILPDCSSYRDEENRILLRAFGYDQSQYCIDVDATDLYELADDMDKLTTRVMAAWVLTPNQRLEELGYDRSDDPNMDLIYIPSTNILLDDIAMPTLDPNAPGMDTGNPGQDNQPDAGQQVSNVPKGYSGNGHKKGLPLTEVDEIWGKALTKNKNGKPL
jgi:phage portal protein BeeE